MPHDDKENDDPQKQLIRINSYQFINYNINVHLIKPKIGMEKLPVVDLN